MEAGERHRANGLGSAGGQNGLGATGLDAPPTSPSGDPATAAARRDGGLLKTAAVADLVSTERGTTAGPDRVPTERGTAAGPDRGTAERGTAAGPGRVPTERGTAAGPDRVSTERGTAAGPDRVPARRVTIAAGPPMVSGGDRLGDRLGDGLGDRLGDGPAVQPAVTAGDGVSEWRGRPAADMAGADPDRPPLRCAVCGQHFRNPKILPCLHTFCQHCLRRHVPPESLSVSCPSCKCQSILPPAGVSGLQTNLLLAVEPESCAACAGTGTCPTCLAVAAEESLTGQEESDHSDSDSADSEAGSDITREPSGDRRHGSVWQLFCSNHAGQTLRFFCRDCETAVCASCTDILHAQHSTCRLTETGPEQRQALLTLRQWVSSQMDVQRRRRALLSATGGQLSQARQQTERQLQTYCASLIEAVNRRQQALTGLLAQIYRDRVDNIEEQLSSLDSFLSELDACERHMERALEAGSDTEVLLLNKQVTVRVGGRLQPGTAEHAARLRFEPTHTDRLEAQLATFGSILSGPEAAGDGHPHHHHQHQPAASETDRPGDSGGGSVRQPGDHPLQLDIPARPGPGGSHSPGQLHRYSHTPSSSQLLDRSHSPSQLHRHSHSSSPSQLHDQTHSPSQLHRHSLGHSPSQIHSQLHSPSQLRGQSHSSGHSPSPGQSNGHCQMPTSDVSSERSSAERAPVARRSICRSGASPSALSAGSRSSRSSYASQPSSRRSSRRSGPPPPPLPPAEDDLVLSIGQKGRGRGEFSNPQGVCYVTAADRLLVADSNNQCVQVFSSEGECKLRFGVRGRGPGQMQRPCGVAATPDGNYVVSDYENRCLSVFDPLGKLVRRIGHGKLQGPKGVTADRRGNLLVVDNRGSAVVTFSAGGRLLARFGSRGTAQHQLAGPHYVAVDSQDRVVVTDFHNHSVKVFNADGKHLFSFGGNGEAAGQFNAPTGVITDRYDNILVADWGNSRIQVFDNTGRYLSTVNTAATPLYGPQGLAMSPEGHVIVADTGNHAIKYYTYHPLAA